MALDALRHAVATLRSALAALIARVRRTGGYATPEEQDVLRAAEQALAGGAEKAFGVPVVSAEALGRSDGAGEPGEQTSGLAVDAPPPWRLIRRGHRTSSRHPFL